MYKLPPLPDKPGVYIFKDADDVIIYIGKATSLKQRVSSYFQTGRPADWKKTDMLRNDIAQVDHIVTPGELEASILEAKLIREHQPRYNLLLKEGQPFLYLLFTNEDVPRIKLVRNKKARGTYFGPFLQKQQARSAHRYIINTFRLNICNKKIAHGCLDYHLGTCPGSCRPDFDLDGYKLRVALARATLTKDQKKFTAMIKENIAEYNEQFAFEKAKQLHGYLEDIDGIFYALSARLHEKYLEPDIFVATTPKPYGEADAQTISKKLQQLFKSPAPIRTIDCFDISHFQSKQIVGACVRFTDGMPDKNYFRRFRIRTIEQQDDYAALHEIVSRRYKTRDQFPDAILIDGGKGQLSAVLSLIPEGVVCVALAKREERLFGAPFPADGLPLDVHDEAAKVLLALRDYTHHFAISYHRLRRKKEQAT